MVELPIMRRPTSVEVMLLSAIGLWSLNLTVTRYILTHGFQPLAYATVRYGLAAIVFCAITIVAERSLRIARRDLVLVVAAAVAVWVNQLGFVYALKTTSASVIALILAATPIFAALFGLVLGTEWLPRRFWVGAALSLAGVALVALGAGGELRGDLGGIALGILTAATWAVYSMLIAPLMRRYSPSRLSARAGLLGADRVCGAPDGGPGLAARLAGVGAARVRDARPLVYQRLWFHSLDHRPSRATPRRTCSRSWPLLAVVLLGERIDAVQVAGGS
jgi:drug/metabolite transporter (DMT)-like permease